MLYEFPNTEKSPIQVKEHYDNFINNEWVPAADGEYFDNICPITGKLLCKAARSKAADVEKALDAAHAAKDSWGKTPAAERANVLLRLADAMEANLEKLAIAETYDNGKAIRECLAADLPLAIDQLRYFASAIRTQEGHISDINEDTVAYHFYEPLGVVGQIIPWNFPILMACWKIAPALAAGNCIVLKLAEQTPMSFMFLLETIKAADILPKGVLNVINGFGIEAGKPLSESPRISKIAFTGSTATGKLIMHAAAGNIIRSTLELGGKSPNIFFEDIMDEDDDFLDKCVEGLVLFALNQGEVCTCPSRALVHEKIYDKFMERCLKRIEAIKRLNPLDTESMMGAQVSNDQMEKILSYIEIGKKEGAKLLIGGTRDNRGGEFENGYYVTPTVLEGNNNMRVFREEIFGPVLGVTKFSTEEEALEIANDTPYGLAAGVWTRNVTRAYRFGRGIHAGRVYTNCYHLYPAHAAFGGYKESGIGRENHMMELTHYQQVKNLLVSYDPKRLGFF